MAVNYAARACALVGTRFRPQGRGEEGMDCAGLVVATYGISASAVRRDYRLRGDHEAELRVELVRFFQTIADRQIAAGDLLLLQVTAEQLHLAVRTERGFVHAHAGIGRVVETPGLPEWPLVGAFRRRTRKGRG
jgi:hypothetical protein